MMWYLRKWNLTRLNYLTTISGESMKTLDSREFGESSQQIFDGMRKFFLKEKEKVKNHANKRSICKVLSFHWLFCKQLMQLEYISI